MPHTPGHEAGRPTLRDVAERAAVGALTVTRVLRDDPRVLPGTRERVLAAVAELGYRPHPVARPRRPGPGGGLVGLVVTDLADPFCARLAEGVDGVLGPHGLRTVLGNTREDLDGERALVADLADRRVDGIIVLPAAGDQRHLAAAAARGVPVVCAGRPPAGFEADHVLVDDFGGAREATVRLLALGHRRIGYLGPPATGYAAAERLRDYLTALAAAGRPATDELIGPGQRDPAAAERAAAGLLALPEPPTALFCADRRNTVGAVRAVTAAGGVTALAGFDDGRPADEAPGPPPAVRPLTVQTYDSAELGRAAGRLLIDRIRNAPDRGPGPRRTVVPTRSVRYGTPPAAGPGGGTKPA